MTRHRIPCTAPSKRCERCNKWLRWIPLGEGQGVWVSCIRGTREGEEHWPVHCAEAIERRVRQTQDVTDLVWK